MFYANNLVNIFAPIEIPKQKHNVSGYLLLIISIECFKSEVYAAWKDIGVNKGVSLIPLLWIITILYPPLFKKPDIISLK